MRKYLRATRVVFATAFAFLVFGEPAAAITPLFAARQATAPSVSAVDTSFARAVAVTGTRGMVVSAHPLATEAGLSILREGGNAADAAIAVAAALNVVEPHASGLGGGGFCLYYDAAHDSFMVFDFREQAPRSLNREVYFQRHDTLHLLQRTGATSVLVPGAPAGWQALHRQFATKHLARLLTPAIALADDGYAVSEKQATILMDHYADLQADSALAQVFLSGGLPPAAGQKLKQPQLARTLWFLSRTRLDNLYGSPLADCLLRALQAKGSMMTRDDLRSYQVRMRAPLRAFYHGYEIITLGPPSSGGTALLEILRIVEPLDLKGMGYLSAGYVHVVASAARQALKDTDTWIADPDFHYVPVEKLLSDEWIDVARARLRMDSIAERVTAMDSLRAYGSGNTTHLVVADSAGNLVSLTQSINYFFGANLMVPELGLLLNNHMADFSTERRGRRAIAPEHRPPSNMAATIVRQGGRPLLVIGSPGGPRIAPTLAQVLISVLDFGLPLHEALNAPRFFPAGKTLVMETRITEETRTQLAAKGWKIQPLGSVNAYFGGVHAIQIDSDTGTLTGAADPRRDGAAAGY